MKISFLILFFGFFSIDTIGQMNAQDSLLNSEAQWLDFDCYNHENSSQFFIPYSNEQESCIIYNLELKDSIVKYYYSGRVASIGLYYGCEQDTIWSTTFTEIEHGNSIPMPSLNVGETLKKEDYFITIDSTEYIFYTGYQLNYSPIYEMTIFNENGKIVERKCNGRSLYIDFKSIIRDKYRKPD